MRTAPPVRIVVGIGGMAAGGVALLVALASGAAAATMARLLDAPSDVTAVAVIPIGALGFWFVFGRLQGVPQRLSWDGRSWSLGPAGRIDLPVREGRVRVMLDAGVWMLIRFDAVAPPCRKVWLGAARSGQGPVWHGLRCAVYSPPPPVGPNSVGAVPAAE